MAYDFQKLSKDILIIDSQKDFDMYLESNFVEIEEYFLNITNDELDDIKFDIEDFLYDLLDNKLIQKQNSKIANAFLILLAEKFLQTSFIGAITILVEHLPKGATKFRLEAAKLYLRINDITKDYFIKSDGILSLIEESAKIDEYNTFENHNVITEANFAGYSVNSGELSVELPPCSIVLLRIEEN